MIIMLMNLKEPERTLCSESRTAVWCLIEGFCIRHLALMNNGSLAVFLFLFVLFFFFLIDKQGKQNYKVYRKYKDRQKEKDKQNKNLSNPSI